MRSRGAWLAGALALAAGAAASAQPVQLKAVPVAEGLSVPVYATAAPGDSERLFVVENESGKVRVVLNGVLLPGAYIDVYHMMENTGGEQGLLGLAFHPDYATNGYSYVAFTRKGDEATVVVRFTRSDDPNHAKAKSAFQILEVPQPHHAHNGGMLAFGPDGMLYVALGDGGFGYDPQNNAQNLGNLLGKIVRIDVDGGTPYAIPADNPFAAVPEAAGEIYLYGFRNPWRFSFDRATGDLWIGDVGQENREEVDFLPGGHPGGVHFGWRCLEGTKCTSLLGCACAPFGEPAFLEYNHLMGCAVIGGYVYRGAAIPELQGTYFFADHCGTMWSVRNEGGVAVELTDRSVELLPNGPFSAAITSFGEDANGEILFCLHDQGQVMRIERAEPPPDCDGDGTSDADEIAGGAFDVNGDGVPDECQHLLTVDPLVPGGTAALAFVGAEPAEPVYLLAGLGGVGAGPCFFGSLCLDLLEPFQLLTVLPAGPDGAAALAIGVPADAPPVAVSFQAVLVRGAGGVDSVKSNAVTAVVGG